MKLEITSAITACMVTIVSIRALCFGYTDEDIKSSYVYASKCFHYDFGVYQQNNALRTSNFDTNRFARVIRQLAEEDANQVEFVISCLGYYKAPQSLPFLYSYSTNLTCGAEALKSIFAIEGVTSNSVAATRNYLEMTNSRNRH